MTTFGLVVRRRDLLKTSVSAGSIPKIIIILIAKVLVKFFFTSEKLTNNIGRNT